MGQPLRRKNFADLRLDENIRVDEDRVRIEVPEHMMKGKKRAFNAEWPAALKSEFFRYRDAIRPLLLGGEHGPAGYPPAEDAFWISERGTKLTADAIYRQVRQLAEEVLGQKINLHKFRNIAASTLAIHDPAQINLAQPVLGHNDPRSKEFYIQANQLAAVRRSHAVEDRILNSAAAEERAEKHRQKPY
jgi:integrase/recombinase XerD